MELLIDNQLFPCISYFKLLVLEKHVEMELYENFKKSSFHNRYVIAGANGLINLTIPVVGGREQKTLFKDIKIDFSNPWQKQQWRSITSAYSKAPFFEYYSEIIRSLIFNSEDSLFSFNISIIEKICSILNINVIIKFSSSYKKENELDGVLDFRSKFLPGNFQKEASSPQTNYSQVFEDRFGFQRNLSILDLLFCEGPNATNLLIS